MNVTGNSQDICAETEPASGWVYFIYSAGLIKIGYTADIFRRMADLKNMGGATIELVGLVQGSKDFEKSLHRMFKADRKHGEWFHPSSELRRFLSCLDDACGALLPPDVLPKIGSCIKRLELAEAGHDTFTRRSQPDLP